MFLLLYGRHTVPLIRTQTWRLNTKLYKFGWHTSAINARMKNSKDLIFGEVVYIYQSSIVSQILDFNLFIERSTIFSFDHMTGENRDLVT